MPSPSQPSPIPLGPQPTRKKSGVLQSSLDLVFSYSRSQQALYGKNLRSAPSFLETSSHSLSPSDAFPSRDEEAGIWGDDGADAGEEGVGEGEGADQVEGESVVTESSTHDTLGGRRRSSASPGIFTADPFVTSPPAPAPFHPDRTEGSTPNVGTRGLLAQSLGGTPGYGAVSGKRIASTSSTSTAIKSHLSHPGQRALDGATAIGPKDLGETTPLLPLKGSHPGSPISSREAKMPEGEGQAGRARRKSSIMRRLSADVTRRSSQALRRLSEVSRGDSTDGQTLFNAVAVLLGIGVLSLPLAFAYAGWVAGTAMLIGFAWLTCHTAKLLARLIKADPSMLGYTDIGRAAFGQIGGQGINILFCLELFALGVALIVLFGDTLEVLYPSVSSNTFKLLGLIIVLPTTLLPLHLLSLPSLLSTVSTFLLVIVILANGFTKTKPPGSLIHPAHTDLWPEFSNANWLGGVGLILAGFGGHAVVPSLARDMRNPEHFDMVIDWAFAIASGVSFVAGAAGYLMIGNTVSDEITRDLMQPKYGYPRWLNLIALWMIAIIPLTKFGLCSRPLNVAIETLLGLTSKAHATHMSALSAVVIEDEAQDEANGAPDLDPSAPPPADLRRASKAAIDAAQPGGVPRYKYLRVVTRTVITCLCTLTAILLPGFGKVMAFLGSFSAFLICIILPLGFYLKLEEELVPGGRGGRRQRVTHWVLIVFSCGLMIAGTIWAFLPGSGHGNVDSSV